MQWVRCTRRPILFRGNRFPRGSRKPGRKHGMRQRDRLTLRFGRRKAGRATRGLKGILDPRRSVFDRDPRDPRCLHGPWRMFSAGEALCCAHCAHVFSWLARERLASFYFSSCISCVRSSWIIRGNDTAISRYELDASSMLDTYPEARKWMFNFGLSFLGGNFGGSLGIGSSIQINSRYRLGTRWQSAGTFLSLRRYIRISLERNMIEINYVN